MYLLTQPELDSILLNIPLQLLAYHAALARSTDIDQPRNLAKSVTVESRDGAVAREHGRRVAAPSTIQRFPCERGLRRSGWAERLQTETSPKRRLS